MVSRPHTPQGGLETASPPSPIFSQTWTMATPKPSSGHSAWPYKAEISITGTPAAKDEVISRQGEAELVPPESQGDCIPVPPFSFPSQTQTSNYDPLSSENDDVHIPLRPNAAQSCGSPHLDSYVQRAMLFNTTGRPQQQKLAAIHSVKMPPTPRTPAHQPIQAPCLLTPYQKERSIKNRLVSLMKLGSNGNAEAVQKLAQFGIIHNPSLHHHPVFPVTCAWQLQSRVMRYTPSRNPTLIGEQLERAENNRLNALAKRILRQEEEMREVPSCTARNKCTHDAETINITN